MNAFEQYLQQYEVDPIILAVVGKVRYLTIWNAKKGNPITSENAQKIKQALLNLTGVPYTGSFVLLEQHLDQLPTISVKKMQRSHYS